MAKATNSNRAPFRASRSIMTKKAGTLTIGAREGRYAGMPERRSFRIRWITPGRALDLDGVPDTSVDYAGKFMVIKR